MMQEKTRKKKLIIGISGASGIIYGIRLLEMLSKFATLETHLVVSQAAQLTRHYETTLTKEALYDLADYHYSICDLGANIASGSFRTDGMIIAPCSMNTLAEIANGITQNLLTRAADVILKERKRLVLLTRESPLHLIHLENMCKVTQLGAIIAPPVPAFYNHPETIDDIINHTIGRALDLFDIHHPIVKRWQTSSKENHDKISAESFE